MTQYECDCMREYTSDDVLYDCFNDDYDVDSESFPDEWDYMMNAPYTEKDEKRYERQVKNLTGKYPDELDEYIDDLPF